MPNIFKDLTKSADDLLGDDFDLGTTAKVKTTNDNLTWTGKAVTGAKGTTTSLEGKFKANGFEVSGKGESGKKDKITFKANNKDGITKGLKVYGETSITPTAYTGKAGVTFTQDQFVADASLTGCDAIGANVNGTFSVVDNIVIGANVNLDLGTMKKDDKADDKADNKADNKAEAAKDDDNKDAAKDESPLVKDWDVAVGYVSGKQTSIVVKGSNLDTVSVSLFQEINPDAQFGAVFSYKVTEVAAEADNKAEGDKKDDNDDKTRYEHSTSLDLGVSYNVDDNSTFKAKINKDAQVGLSFSNQINKNTTLIVSAATALSQLEDPKTTQVGLTLNVSA